MLGRHAPIQLLFALSSSLEEFGRNGFRRNSKKKCLQSFPTEMAIFLILLAIPCCFSCNAHTMSKSRAKIVEEYVVSAKFDKSENLPQLSERNRLGQIYQEDETKLAGQLEAKDASLLLPSSPRGNHKNREQLIDDFEDRNTLEERDLSVHHHHLPPLPHPLPPAVPPPPPPVGLAYTPSLFAVGLITFLILLNSLQTSLLLILKSKSSVLGAVTGGLGRRKRFVPKEIGKAE